MHLKCENCGWIGHEDELRETFDSPAYGVVESWLGCPECGQVDDVVDLTTEELEELL